MSNTRNTEPSFTKFEKLQRAVEELISASIDARFERARNAHWGWDAERYSPAPNEWRPSSTLNPSDFQD